ncbi:hypothetical protein GE061_000751 [Apolygus lucorum]|uniref:Transmembrane protein 192 n=1 Tax=Apolygus lucorum TaxID=248454 RepID=A0A8S9Y6Q7_APOLU|nr:hypothetical protein GE061_000751 [Apolygus lucorum]
MIDKSDNLLRLLRSSLKFVITVAIQIKRSGWRKVQADKPATFPGMEPTAGEYEWQSVNSRPQVPPFFDLPFKLRTLRPAVFQGVLMTTFLAVTIWFKAKHFLLDGQCSNLTVLLFTQVSLWMISLIYQHFFTSNHNILREHGYNLLSSKFQRKSSYLFYILTCTNAFIVLYVAASITYAPSVLCDWECPYSALNLTTYTILAQGVLYLVATYSYVHSIKIFNSTELIPDVHAITGIIDLFYQMELNGPVDHSDHFDQLRRHLREQSYLNEYYFNLFHRLRELGVVRESMFGSFTNQNDECTTGRCGPWHPDLPSATRYGHPPETSAIPPPGGPSRHNQASDTEDDLFVFYFPS